MNVRILEPMTVTKMPPVLTLLEVTHVLVCWATQEMEQCVKVCIFLYHFLSLYVGSNDYCSNYFIRTALDLGYYS